MSPDYAQAIHESDLPRKDRIVATIRPSYLLRLADSAARTRPLGGSRLGGRPDLPPDFEWPSWEGKPQAFLAQIHLDALPAGGPPERELLPASGRLYFFYDQEQRTWGFDPRDRGSFLVAFSDAPTDSLKTAPPATGLTGDADAGRDVTAFESLDTVPEFDSPALESLDLSQSELGLYTRIVTDAEIDSGLVEVDDPFEIVRIDQDGPDDEAMNGFQDGDEGDHEAFACEDDDAEFDDRSTVSLVPLHQMFGHARSIQGSMQHKCELVRAGLYCGDSTGYEDPRAEGLKARWDDWVLLLQLDSDDDLGWCWGDVGRLYFWIRRADLQAHRFDQAWLILQCS